MQQTPPTGPQVRVRRIVAGSFIAAVSAASTAGLAAPAEAGTGRAEASVFSPASPATPDGRSWNAGSADPLTGSPAAGPSVTGPSASAVSVPPASTVLASQVSAAQGSFPAEPALAEPAPAERLRAVRAELDGAVALGLVTPEQADGFYAQMERRVAAGR